MENVTATDATGILDRINAKTTTTTTDDNKTDFLKLLVAQLENQDPLNPQDGGDFLAQLAQLETVQGIGELNGTFSDFTKGMLSSQALQATTLVGRNVLLGANASHVKAGDSLTGKIALPEDALRVKMSIFDSNGALVRTLELGAQKQGNLDFSWDGVGDDEQAVPAGQYSIVAEASIKGESTELSTAINFNVNSVTIDQTRGAFLNLDGQPAVASLSDVLEIH